MPVHRLAPDAKLEKAVEDILESERIVGAAAIDGCLVVITEPRAQKHQRASAGKETRS